MATASVLAFRSPGVRFNYSSEQTVQAHGGKITFCVTSSREDGKFTFLEKYAAIRCLYTWQTFSEHS